MELVLISISLFDIILSVCFIVSSILKLIKKETIYTRVILIASSIMISLMSIPGLIISIILDNGQYVSMILKLIVWAVLSFFHIYFTYWDIKRKRPPFVSSDNNTK